MECARPISQISIRGNNSTYYGIKRLWKSEVDCHLKALPYTTHSAYRILNSNYQNLEEYWIVEKDEDLPTLRQYLKDYDREQDFNKIQKVL